MVVTKKCSECGEVLESVAQHTCDGCGKDITTLPEDYDNQIRLGFLSEDHETHIPELVYCTFECYMRHKNEIKLDGVHCVSIEFMSPKLFVRLNSQLEVQKT